MSTIDAGRFCAFSTFARFLRQHEIRRHVDLERPSPDAFGRNRRIRRRKQRGGVDDAVEAAELQHRGRNPAAIVSREVRSIDALIAISLRRQTRGVGFRLLRTRDVRVRDDDVAAALGDLQRDFTPDAAASADHDDDLAAEFLLGRHPLQLGLLERPVLDAEGLGPRQRDVVVERLEVARLLGPTHLRQLTLDRAFVLERVRARHHVNRVDEELGRDARFALVLAEPEQSEAGHDDHRGIRVAELR